MMDIATDAVSCESGGQLPCVVQRLMGKCAHAKSVARGKTTGERPSAAGGTRILIANIGTQLVGDLT